MPPPIHPRIIEARIAALEECAKHLDPCWTNDVFERHEGEVLAAELRTRAAKWKQVLAMRKQLKEK